MKHSFNEYIQDCTSFTFFFVTHISLHIILFSNICQNVNNFSPTDVIILICRYQTY
jgi:hypothetical protein